MLKLKGESWTMAILVGIVLGTGSGAISLAIVEEYRAATMLLGFTLFICGIMLFVRRNDER